MRFPALDQLNFPCRFSEFIAGELHPDGRRYLPLIVLEPLGDLGPLTPPNFRLGVVDRHHRVDPQRVGSLGNARLVYALSTLKWQKAAAPQHGFQPEHGLPSGRISTSPLVYGQIQAIPAWEVDREHLDYEVVYAELVIQVGGARLGLRTSAAASNLAEHLGREQFQIGDWIEIGRSRIDILAFE